MAAILLEAWVKLIEIQEKHEWWSRLNHRLLIHISIECGFYRRGQNPDPADLPYWYSRQTLVKMLQEEVLPTYAKEASTLVEVLNRVMPLLSSSR